MARLETLEAKMASIEVSLSTTPRRKKCSVGVGGPPGGSKEIARELDRLRNTLRDKENLIHSLKGEAWRWGGERERSAARERLAALKADLQAKRITINNIKLALDAIHLTDNIDVRIQQAELEYQLGREELNLLTLLEESRNLHTYLEQANLQQQTIFGYVVDRCPVSLHCVELSYDAKSPQFGAGSGREEGGGLFVEWAVQGSGLAKGDRLLEVNGKVVLGRSKEDMCRLLSVSPSPAQLVVMRREGDLRAELSLLREKAGQAERLRDTFRTDNVRLSHRISYLEEQVAELLERAKRGGEGDSRREVFQKGPEKTALPEPSPHPAHHRTSTRYSEDGSSRSRSSLRELLDRRNKYECESEPGGYKKNGERPLPPKKPARLSLHKAKSLQSVDALPEKKILKRNHKGEAPRIPHTAHGWC